MKKQILLALALFALIGTSAVFAQRVGETVHVGGQTYVVESVSGDRLTLVKAGGQLNGIWDKTAGGVNAGVITFSGTSADITELRNPNNGITYIRNIQSTGAN